MRGACPRDGDGGPAVLIGLPWAEGGALYNAYALLDGGADRGRALQGRPAELRRLRREARLRAGSAARSDRCPRRPVRRPDLRGHLDRRGRRMPDRDGLRDPARPERLALLARQDGRALQHRRRPRSPKAACRSSTSTRSADRTSSSSTAPPSSSTPIAASPRSCRPSGKTIALTVWERGADGWRCAEGPRRFPRRATRPITRPACWALRDYVEKNRFPGVVLGLSGGIDSALCAAMAVDALGRGRGSIASCCPIRYTSQRVPRRRGGLRRGARRALRHPADRARGRRLRGGCCSRSSPGARATSPKRTCRAAPAARS